MAMDKVLAVLDLQSRRESIGMTRKELAELSTMSQALIYRIERGKRLPSLETLCKLVNYVGPLRIQYGSGIYRMAKIDEVQNAELG